MATCTLTVKVTLHTPFWLDTYLKLKLRYYALRGVKNVEEQLLIDFLKNIKIEVE